MSSALFSTSWYRVEQMRPALRGHARLVRHSYRGQRWYVLQDQASGRFLRLNEQAWRIVGLMDGQRSLAQIWEQACLGLGDEAPTQDEILQLLTQLHQANVLLSDRRPDLDDLEQRRRKLGWARIKQYLGNPLSLKLPLVDPDRLLGLIARLMPPALLPWLLLAWLALVGSGIVGAAMHWQELSADITSRVFTAQNMLLLALAFPVLKAIHELGHGLALKLLGLSCHEMGLMFLVAVPVPYVDASQASALKSKYQRMLVGLAGMMAELAVAAVALWLWVLVSPGVGKAFLHQVLIAAGVSTLIFNANPLLRFDGYYVLADWLEIPNLAQKSNQYLGHLINRHLFRVREGLQPPPLTPREAPWLLGYCIASFCYRMLVAVGIVLLVAPRFFFLGVLLAIWSAWGTVGKPLLSQFKYLALSPVLQGRRALAWSLSLGFATALTAFIALVPLPSWTNAEGVIWMPEASRVRAHHACFGMAVLSAPGSTVRAGQRLLACTDPELDAQQAQAEAKRGELGSRLRHAQALDRVQAQVVEAELRHASQRLADLDERRAQLSIAAPVDGIFVMPSPQDFPGRYLERGEHLAYVLEPRHFSLLTVVGQGEVDRVRQHTTRVELRSVDRIGQLLAARLEREVPAATTQLPSLALALQGGGKIGLDPGSNARQEPQALDSLFHFELRLLGDALPQAVGQRVYVRFVHEPEPLARQWYRPLRQLFLKTFAS
ncbi:PqqD family peptide modification chaperone [Roseateles sp.]|jgi:putative peptide zinc metalloprotease protein|uniref:PqqD family peptide modification chaperone n=1 Tax=Roseateles sp. TaxID=1971397 RepID=UPI00391AD5C5